MKKEYEPNKKPFEKTKRLEPGCYELVGNFDCRSGYPCRVFATKTSKNWQLVAIRISKECLCEAVSGPYSSKEEALEVGWKDILEKGIKSY